MIKIGQDILHYQDKVLEWNDLFGNDVNNKNLITEYKDFTLEEISSKNELISSAIKNDNEGILDAICDIIYTGFMYLALNGKKFVLDEEFTDITAGVSFLSTGVTLKTSLENDDIDNFKMYLVNIIEFAKTKFYLNEAFSRVTESNFSKAFHLKDNETSHDLFRYKASGENNGRYGDVFFIYHNGYYIGKAKKDLRDGKEYPEGKIIKGDWYSSVEDLGGLKEFIK